MWLENSHPVKAPTDQFNCIKASICVKVERPFCVIKRQAKTRCRGLAQSAVRLHTLLALPPSF